MYVEVQGLLWEVPDPSIRIPCFLRAPWHPKPAGEPCGSFSFCGPQARAQLTYFTPRWCGAEADGAAGGQGSGLLAQLLLGLWPLPSHAASASCSPVKGVRLGHFREAS